MDKNPKPGECYRHFKNKLYQIITVAVHTETGEEMVVYQALYGAFGIYARPLTMFLSEVDHEKYPDVKQIYRFEKVEKCTLEENETVTAKEEEGNILPFLEADDYAAKLEVLRARKNRFTKEELNTLCEVMDVRDDSGTPEEKYLALEGFLRVQTKYDGARLR